VKRFGYEFETLAKQHHSGRSFRSAAMMLFTSLVVAQLSEMYLEIEFTLYHLFDRVSID